MIKYSKWLKKTTYKLNVDFLGGIIMRPEKDIVFRKIGKNGKGKKGKYHNISKKLRVFRMMQARKEELPKSKSYSKFINEFYK